MQKLAAGMFVITLGLFVMTAMALGGCTAAPATTDKAAFMASYRPLNGEIDVVSDALTLDYAPRIRARGIAAVNRQVNTVPYKMDRLAQERLDPDRFWLVGGDCDKHALTKLLELRAQGVQTLYYLVLVDGPKGESHAVLITDDNGVMVALDNRTDRPVPIATLYRDYMPAYFVDAHTRQVWVSRRFEASQS